MRHGTDEVAANFELATNSRHVETAAALKILDFAGAVELGPVELDAIEACAAAKGEVGHWACVAVARCRSEVEEALRDQVSAGFVMPVNFDFDADVERMTCAPWRTESLELHVVVSFRTSRLGGGALQLHGEGRALQLARILSERPNGYTVHTGECFCSIDARMQNRVCISRGATHTSILFRCNFIQHLEHHPILNLPMADMSGKDGRENLEVLHQMRYKVSKDDAGYLDVSGDGTVAISRMRPRAARGRRRRSLPTRRRGASA